MQPIVNGATKLLFIVGDPIAQVRSPLIYNPKILAAGRNCILVPLLVPQAEFEQTIQSVMRIGNLEGLIITIQRTDDAFSAENQCGCGLDRRGQCRQKK